MNGEADGRRWQIPVVRWGIALRLRPRIEPATREPKVSQAMLTALDGVGYVRFTGGMVFPARWPAHLGSPPTVGESVRIELPSGDPTHRDAAILECRSRGGVGDD
jgi:hypothetical protein